MVGLQTLDLAIGVRVPASQCFSNKRKTGSLVVGLPVLCACSVPTFRIFTFERFLLLQSYA